MTDPYAQLRAVEAEMLVPRGAQTIVTGGRIRPPVPYVDRTSGKPWPSGGPLPFSNQPVFR